MIKILTGFIFAFTLTSCSTLDNRSKPPPIEHFNSSYESIQEDLIKTNSFAFIYKNETYYFHLASTYIDQGPQLYYLGYRNGTLQYIFTEKNLYLLKNIFESKDFLYHKTQRIVEKLNEINEIKVKSTPYHVNPKHSVLYDLTNDTLTFTIYGSMALIGLPWVAVGYAEHLSKMKIANRLNKVRLGMSVNEVNNLLPIRTDRKKIDQYDVEFYTSHETHWYTNALLIFESNKLVGIIRNITSSPVSDYFKKQ